MAAFREAIGRAGLISGRVGVDVGTGRDAILAQLCIRAGARKVFALEANKDAARAAAKLIARLGLEDQVEVIHAWAQDLKSLPETADFLVQELLGEVASVEGAEEVLAHARQHFLIPDAFCVPAAARTILVGGIMPPLDSCIMVGPTGRVILSSAANATATLTSEACVELLQFSTEVHTGQNPARRSLRSRRTFGATANRGQLVSLRALDAGEISSLRLHMEFLPHHQMSWHSSLAKFSHWRHIHVPLDEAAIVARGDTLQVQSTRLAGGGLVLERVFLARGAAQRELLEQPVALDQEALHGDCMQDVSEISLEPVVVMGSGDACWAPCGTAAVIIAFDDGQQHGKAGFLLEPVRSEDGPLGWIAAEEVIDWRLMPKIHPLADVMISQTPLPAELCERAQQALANAQKLAESRAGTRRRRRR